VTDTDATPATPPATAAPTRTDVLPCLLRADLTVLVKNRRSLLMSLLLPILLLLVTNTQRGEQRLGGAPLIIGLCVTYGLVSTSLMGYATTVARDRDNGVFQRLRVTPASSWAIMTSRLAVQMLANLIIALVVVFAGARIHHLSFTVGQYLLTLAISILGGAVFLGVGQALVGLVRSAEAVNSTGRLLYIALVFLGLLGLEGTLGPTFHDIAQWSPVGALMTLYAAVLNTATWSGTDTGSLVTCVGYLLCGATVGIRWFNWNPQ
jgi:ABC-2 type transport system permease protein